MLKSDESGLVTAEYAVALPAILIVFLLAIGGLMHVNAYADACHGARLYAREISIGASPASSHSVAQAGTPARITVRFSQTDSLVHVTAQSSRHFPGLSSPACTVTAIRESSRIARGGW